MKGIHWQKDVVSPASRTNTAQTNTGGGTCPDCLTYHGGPVMPTTRVLPIYWGTSWSNPAFVGDKITGLDTFYKGYINSDYEDATMSEYCSGSGLAIGSQTCKSVTSAVNYVQTSRNSGKSGVTYPETTYGYPTRGQGWVLDNTPASGGQKTSAILKEVCSVIQEQVNDNGFVPSSSDYYPVYVDLPVANGYCAYHSYGSCSYTAAGKTSSVPVQFGFVWNADGNAGCAAGDGTTSATGVTITGHSEGLGSLVDSSVHELSETRTDPSSPSAWRDSSGAEDGDKCEWNTGYTGQPTVSTAVPRVTLHDNSVWVLQPHWSNLEALGASTPGGPSVFPYTYAEQGFSSKGVPSGSYGCVYGTTGSKGSYYR